MLILLFALIIAAACGGGSIGRQAGSADVHAQSILESMPFRAGVAHSNGRYGFTQQNFLLEGAQRISSLGAKAIFVYLTPAFRSAYPERSGPHWPASQPQSLRELAQSEPFQQLFAMPFDTYVLTAYGFANGDGVKRFATDAAAAAAEEQEFYDLTRYLLTTYAGTGKVFILKHWEGDCIGTGTNWGIHIPANMVTAMINWLQARQRGVSRARQDAGPVKGVEVYHAVEVNRVFDYSERGLTRVINAVVPYVNADLVSYSSYDSTLRGNDAGSTAAAMDAALQVIDEKAPDPLGLGRRRIFISEFGLFETERGDPVWRTQAILDTARSEGLLAAFMWQVYDNECKAGQNYFPVDPAPGELRPSNRQCRGLWLFRPDGSPSATGSVLKKYF